MDLQQRLDLLERLRKYILSDHPEWLAVVEKAHRENGWFTPEFINLSIATIATEYLDPGKLQAWIENYNIPAENREPKTIGMVMAGNIPLVGFHDFLSVFVCGHRQTIKPSSKDETLIRHLVSKLQEWDSTVNDYMVFADMLKGSDAYIATGSNNSSRYFEFYFKKYKHIIRRNRTSVAVLTGKETHDDLEKLADDVYQYFGLGCRNVSKIFVPKEYDFIPLLEAFKKYQHFADHNKYRNNYDYQLALLIMNKQYYMTNGTIILHEQKSEFSAISRLNYEFYTDRGPLFDALKANQDIQCIVAKEEVPLGDSQRPALDDYADGVDTMQFLRSL